MTTWLVIVQSTLSVFGIVVLGGLARHQKWLTKEADSSILKLIISFLMPSLIFHTVMTTEYQNPQAVWKAPIFGAVSVLIGMFFAALITHFFGDFLKLKTPASRRAFIAAIGIFNYGYIPIPLITALFGQTTSGQETLGILFIHNFGVEFAMLTLGVVVISGEMDKNVYRKIFNPPAITLMVSLLLKFLMGSDFSADFMQAAQPITDFLIKIAGMTGIAAIPLGLLLIGATVLDEWLDAENLFQPRVIVTAILIRLAILPALLIGLLWLLGQAAPLSIPLLRVTTMASIMPAAIFPIVLCRHYGGDTPTAVRVALSTCLASLLTIPPSLLLCWRLFPIAPSS